MIDKKIKNCFILGPARSGTAFLHSILVQHPEISGSIKKEPNFFNLNSNFNQGINFYHSMFDRKKYIYLDSSHRYFYLPYVADRIKSYNADSKFIIILRNPLRRIFSHYYYQFSRNIEKMSFSDAINHDMDRLNNEIYFSSPEDYDKYKKKYGCDEPIDYYRTYIDSGLIFQQYKNFLKFFSKKNFIFINFDELIYDTGNTLNKISLFLEIDNFSNYKLPHTKNESRAFLLSKLTSFLIKFFPYKKYIPFFIKKFYIYFISLISKYFFSNPIDKLINKNKDIIPLITDFYHKDHEQLKNISKIDIMNLKH